MQKSKYQSISIVKTRLGRNSEAELVSSCSSLKSSVTLKIGKIFMLINVSTQIIDRHK